MQKTIFLILTLFAAFRASAVPIDLTGLVDDQNYWFDFKVTLNPGSGLPAGTVIKGQVYGQYEEIGEVNLLGGKFDYYDYSQKHAHQVAWNGYSNDMESQFTSVGGDIDIIGEHPRNFYYNHDLQMDFDLITGKAYGFVESGVNDGGSGMASIDFVKYHYDFTGTIEFSLHIPPQPRNPPTIPETNSTLALMGVAFGLLIVARKKLALPLS